ncbi:unannotated protein [freshwater metagenome]|uniref:Unannotated protein n=1 Tax=freshwater metagenome TaxID=449393 RepID=A0A6J7XPF2_9ZZZZ|nr:aminotransferase class V-fold PLP-dependent enzyme [Actinomycetota bacterium]
MVRVTGNFQSESPIHPKALALLESAFEAGWADPKKLGQASAKAALLRNEAIESIASHLKIHPSQIETFGDPALGHHLSLTALMQERSQLVHSAIDRSEIFAIAQSARTTVLPVNHDGNILGTHSPSPHSVLALQIANGETGVIQKCDEIIEDVQPELIALDATVSGFQVELPRRWNTALFSSASWEGPAGVGILAIADRSVWRNPLPHISAARTGLSAYLPLLLASALALEERVSMAREEELRRRQLTTAIRSELSKIADCDIAGNLATSLPHITSASFMYCNGEEIIRSLAMDGFSVDSGSACTSENLEPSHVLAAMQVLTHGNVRITVHSGTTHDEVMGLLRSLSSTVIRMRA